MRARVWMKLRGMSATWSGRLATVLLSTGLCLPIGHAQTTALDLNAADVYQAALQALAQGDKRTAQTLLERVVQQTPEHAGAWLDLALLYCELGDERSAYALFERIERELQPPLSIQALITKAREQGCRLPKAWMAQAQVALGHSSNVNYGPSVGVIRFAPSAPFSELFLAPSQRPQADSHLTADLMWVLPARTDNWLGAQWQAMVQAKQHQQVKAFDTQTVALGATWRGVPRDSARWQAWGLKEWEVAAYGSHWLLGGNAYETSAQVWASTWSNEWLYSPITWRWGYEGGLGQFTYPGNSVYDSVRADARLRVQARWQGLGLGQVGSLSIGPLKDQAINHRPGGSRAGYTVNAQWSLSVSPHQQLVVYLQHQKMKEQSAYNPLFFGGVERSPSYQIMGLKYQQTLASGNAWSVAWMTQKTKDQLDIFSYKNQQLNLSYQWVF